MASGIGASGGGLRDGASRRSNIIAYFLQSGSSRVLNSLRVGTQLMERGGPTPPKFLFKTQILNRSVIFKDLYIETAYGGTKITRVGTKLYIPFDVKRLADGGQTFFYDRREFTTLMGEFVDQSDPVRREGLNADSQILEMLDTLPTFAPFLLRDLFERAEIAVDPLYVEIPEREWEEIRAFIRERFRQILTAVTGQGQTPLAAQDALNRLLDKLWDMKDVPALESLAAAFGLPTLGCMERFYAWKGTLYFCWAFENLQRAIFDMGSWLNDFPKLSGVFPPALRAGAKLRFQALHSDLFRQLRDVEMILSEYERAFNDLFVHGAGPGRFIRFLSEAPTKFNECGRGIGVLQHAHEVWDRMTEAFPNRFANYEVLSELTDAVNSILTSN
jgi:hypothetical protein